MFNGKKYLLPRILIALMAVAMLAATVPAYFHPTYNPGLANIVAPASSLGETAGAFLGRQLTVILITLIGAISGYRHLVMIGAFAMMFMNGHDAIFMGFAGGSSATAIAGLVFAVIGALALALVWKTKE